MNMRMNTKKNINMRMGEHEHEHEHKHEKDHQHQHGQTDRQAGRRTYIHTCIHTQSEKSGKYTFIFGIIRIPDLLSKTAKAIVV